MVANVLFNFVVRLLKKNRFDLLDNYRVLGFQCKVVKILVVYQQCIDHKLQEARNHVIFFPSSRHGGLVCKTLIISHMQSAKTN